MAAGAKKRRPPLAVFFFWSRVRESNPPSRLGKPMHYRCTNPAFRCLFSLAQPERFGKSFFRFFLKKFPCPFCFPAPVVILSPAAAAVWEVFDLDFSQLCACGPEGHAQLKRHVDRCAQQGRSYEFAQCGLPAGCRPARADLGFWRDGEDYLIYFRPTVSYQGPSPRLAGFWRCGSHQRFHSFQALSLRLQLLSGELAASAAPPLFVPLNAALQAKVVGQEAAVEAAAFKLCGHICKRAPLRPLSLIFYGPTCVGKSELGKQIAPVLNQLWGEERYRLVWTELNTFTEAHSVYRLTGAPPGYVGYDDQPILEEVRRSPYTIFMFDELDKAHPAVLKVFMSILDEGRCTARRPDGQGERELDFRQCIFLFTTNADLSAGGGRRLGFSAPEPEPPAPDRETAAPPPGPAGLAQRLLQEDERARQALVRTGVLREIAGRFSGLIGFQPLSGAARAAVTARQIAALGREYGLRITQVDPDLAQALTPPDALSLRSTAGVLEGLLTPLLLSYPGGDGTEEPLRLTGTPDAMQLLPA